jgi:cytochrome P450
VNGALPPGPSQNQIRQALLWTRHYREFVADARERYGPTFTARVGGMPAAVVTVDRDAIKRLFTGDPLAKRHGNDLLRTVLGDRSLLLLEPSEHLERRKLLLPPFHGERVRAYADLMGRLIEEDLDEWGELDSVQVLPRAQDLTLEVILQAVFGMRDPQLRARLRSIYDSMVSTAGSSIGFYFPQLTSRWNPLIRKYWRNRDRLYAIVREQIAATRADPRLADRDDILAMLIEARDEDGRGGLTDDDLLDELNTLLAAGHETTATAIAWGVELLAHNPEIAERARGAEPEYLDALVKEVLRIRPPLPTVSARRPTEPFEIAGYTLEPNTTVIVDCWGIHHDPEVYPDPEAFRPERFLEDPPDSYAFMPFGGGAHRCLGASLAQLEIRVVLKAIVERYELQPTEPKIAEPERRGIVFAPHGGTRVRVTPRVAAPVAA